MHTCQPIRTNVTLDFSMTEAGAPSVTEPVSLIEMKHYLKMESISADDDVIEFMIKSARLWVENRCGVSLVRKEVKAIIEVMNEHELPRGPIVKSSITVLNDLGESVTSPNLVGVDFGFTCIRGYGMFTVTYDAGYETAADVPQDYKEAIKAHVAFSYENRGDELDKSNKPYAVECKRLCDSRVRLRF